VNESGVEWNISEDYIHDKYGGGDDVIQEGGEVIGLGYQNVEEALNELIATNTKNLIDNNAAIKEILTNNDYTENDINDILAEARDGNRERLNTMLTYIDSYMNQDLSLTES
jgi:hypothetical protein